MKLFDVYPRFNVQIEKAKGCEIFDCNGNSYLDLYGGHGVISIGHSHPYYVQAIKDQLDKIAFYSNSVEIPLQNQLAQKLGELSGYLNYNLFLCNSGAEANENAIKLASFHTGKKKIIAFKNSFHGRTAAALNVTDNPKLSAPINEWNYEVEFHLLNDLYNVKESLEKGDVAAVIIEGIQGVGGLDEASPEFLMFLELCCKENDALLILDEIQSGYGRTGDFFAHQNAQIKADIITTAKGMGNGFPIAGVLISPKIKATSGLLGTTFGGNQLACAAGLAVLHVLESENLMANVSKLSQTVKKQLTTIEGVKQVKGRGLMLGVEFDFPIKKIRKKLLTNHRIFTGASANPNLLRILPPLSISEIELNQFVFAIKQTLS